MTQGAEPPRYRAEHLHQFASRLLQKAGLPGPMAATTAQVLLEADLLGFSTHGLMYLPANLEWLEKGQTRTSGEPEVLVDRGAVISWNAEYLPGPWVMVRAMDVLCERARQHGVATLTLRKSQHVACLAPYVLSGAERGLAVWMMAATPAESLVCPHGSVRPLFSTNPFAFAFPTGGDPVLAQVIDPEAFGSTDELRRQADHLVRLCRETPTRPGEPPVRIPGERALALKRRQLAEGVVLSPLILPALEPWAGRLDVALPAALAD